VDPLIIENVTVATWPRYPVTACIDKDRCVQHHGILIVTDLDLVFRYLSGLSTRRFTVWRQDVMTVVSIWRPIFGGRPGMRFSTALQAFEFRIPRWVDARAANALLTGSVSYRACY
jgi:hypothetical protein